ncbi:exodeoxyribonuclease VII large subunit, partial [Idiomarina abyssalis]|uniref:exodeoxyribonuclease VII large subunit n=2 Tax=Idiomarinaceae TaxID=267893 RepID=UPI00241D4A99
QHPQRQLQQQSQLADELQARASRALQNRLARQQQRVSYLQGRLQAVHPQKELQRLHEKLNHQQQRLPLVMQRLLKENRARQQQLMQSLNLVSPLNTLERGYAIVRTESGDVVRSEKQVNIGSTIEVRLADGSITAKRQ